MNAMSQKYAWHDFLSILYILFLFNPHLLFQFCQMGVHLTSCVFVFELCKWWPFSFCLCRPMICGNNREASLKLLRYHGVFPMVSDETMGKTFFLYLFSSSFPTFFSFPWEAYLVEFLGTLFRQWR